MTLMLLTLVVLAAEEAPSLELGAKALADFRAEDAVALLERARSEGPYSRTDYIRLYEQLGIAYAYLDRIADALRAFDTLLALDAGRAISYTLSPKVTFVFEQARGLAQDRVPPTIDLGWPLDLDVNASIPVDVEVVADPQRFLRKAKIYTRLKGGSSYSAIEIALPGVGAHQRVGLPPAAPGSTRPEVVEVYLVAYDERGNEVYAWGAPNHPREIAVRYDPPEAWYDRWWIWAIAATVIAGGASAAVFGATRDPGPTVDGTLRVVP